MQKMKAAIVGCGIISDVYLQNLSSKFSVIEVIACCDHHAEKANATAQKYGLRVMNLEALLAMPDIELVINLTNPTAHYSVIKASLEADKHVYTEKVIAADLNEALELSRIADEKGLYLGAAPDTFLGGAGQTARYAVDAGLIGKVTSCYAFYERDFRILAENFPIITRKGGGVGFDIGIYYLTALLSILGPIKRVCGMIKEDSMRTDVHFRPSSPNFGRQFAVEPETMMMGCMEFASGVYGTIHMNAECIQPEQPRLVICGTEGVLTMADPNCFGGNVCLRVKGSEEPVYVPNYFGFNTNMRGVGVAEMAWAIRQGRKHRTDKEMACHAMEVLCGMAKSSKNHVYYDMNTTFQRPRPLPRGYLDSDYSESDPEAALVF